MWCARPLILFGEGVFRSKVVTVEDDVRCCSCALLFDSGRSTGSSLNAMKLEYVSLELEGQLLAIILTPTMSRQGYSRLSLS